MCVMHPVCFFLPDSLNQVTSKTMTSLDQLPLAITRTPATVDIPIEMVWAKRTQGAAFSLACDTSGLDDKEIYMALGIDAGTFSRMRKGTNTLPGDQLKDFCKIVGNTIYADWLAYQVGSMLVVIKSEAERRAQEAEAMLAQERRENQLLRDLLQGRAV